jgi:hypothetical protein
LEVIISVFKTAWDHITSEKALFVAENQAKPRTATSAENMVTMPQATHSMGSFQIKMRLKLSIMGDKGFKMTTNFKGSGT